MQLGDRSLELHDVAVLLLDVSEGVARGGVAGPLEDLLREYLRLRVRPALERCVDLLAQIVRLLLCCELRVVRPRRTRVRGGDLLTRKCWMST